jgi:excisionase family DNA binding protein
MATIFVAEPQCVKHRRRWHAARERRAMTNRILTLSELSRYLQIHRTTIYRMLREGRLPGFRIGSDWRFSLEAIEQWLRDEMETAIEGRCDDSPNAPLSSVNDHRFITGQSALVIHQRQPSSDPRIVKPRHPRGPQTSPAARPRELPRKKEKSEDECMEVNLRHAVRSR